MTLTNYYPEIKIPYNNHGFSWRLFLEKHRRTKTEYSFKKIFVFDQQVTLKKELKAQLSYRNGYYYLDNDYLDIHCLGGNEETVKQDFLECFMMDKEYYCDCDKTELSPSGLKLRNKLERFI